MGHEQRRRGPWYERYPPSELLQLDEQVSKEEALPAQHELDPPHMDTLPMQHALLPPRKGGKALVLAPSDASNTQASIYNFKDSHGGDASAYRTLLKRSGAAGLAGACLSEFPDSFRAGCELEADVSKQQDLEGVLSACTWAPTSTESPVNTVVSWHTQKTAEWHLGQRISSDRYKHERCVVGDPAAPANGDINAASTWELQRVGPFNTTGGKDWSTAMSKWLMCKYCQSRGGADGGLPGGYDANCEQLNVPNGTNCSAADNVEQMDWFASALWADPQLRVIAIREYFLGAMTTGGKLLGYPPIRNLT